MKITIKLFLLLFTSVLYAQNKTSEGEFKHLATAWYCPEIPYTFGPFGYGGLPGLIFELHDKFTSFGLKNLYLKNDSSKIELPKEGKLIEYELLIGSPNVSKSIEEK